MFGNARQAAPDFTPTGDAVDGDTFRIADGRNARLLGVDAFEAGQNALLQSGQAQIGQQSRNALLPFVQPSDGLRSFFNGGPKVTPTGEQTYGRPVVTLHRSGTDAGAELIGRGYALAAPEYLQGNALLPQYMEAERLARLNRRGAFGGQFQAPEDYRAGRKPDPWAKAEYSLDGKGTVIFGDEPTPFQGLRPEIAEAYLEVARNPKSTAADLLAFADANGFKVDPDSAEDFIRKRNSGRPVSDTVGYEEAPQVITDVGDGAIGAAARGVADPVNMLDELGGVVDTLGGTNGRENVWNSERRFGDILWNNIDQNRSILDYDDAFHPWARFGGQVASGVVAPAMGVQGVGLRAATQVLRTGGTRFAAEQAARTAARTRLAQIGAAEGGFAGFGAGEGGPIDRAPSAALGAGIGAVAAPAFELTTPYLGRGIRWAKERFAGQAADAPARLDDVVVGSWKETARNELDEVQSPSQPQRAAMAAEPPVPMLEGPRVVDRIDVGDVPPPPPGFVLDGPIGKVAPLMQRPSPEAMANAVRGIEPGDVTPIPSNVVEGPDEAAWIGAGMRPEMRPPNERDALLPQPGRRSRNPVDLVGFVRAGGGLKDHAGELNAYGFTNQPRDLDFAKDEQFLGKFINQKNGQSLDDAAFRAWEAGYFPNHVERPTVEEFLDALQATYNGGTGRVFHPDDLDAIAAHNAAREQRYAIEAARQEGRPLHEDRGRPVTADDLDANAPPATAYEDLPKVGGRVANLNLANIESSQDIRRLLQTTETRFGGFDAARRGKITHAETEALASELGMTGEALLKRRRGQALNAEQALAARQLLAKSSDEVLRLAKKAQGGTDEDVAGFREAMLRHAAIHEQVTAATAEAGRALQSFRMAAKSKAVSGRIHKHLADASGGRDDLEDLAARLLLEAESAGMSPAGVNKFIVKATKPRFRDKLVELWYNSLLSGPATHVVNVTSNLMTAGLQLPEQATAAAIGQLRRKSADRVLLSEIGPRAFGLMQGAREGLGEFVRTMRTGEVRDPMTKVEAQTQRAISGIKGEILRTPTRFLSAEDEFFKAIGRRMELNGLAVRKARSEGLKGEALEKRVSELAAEPPDDMLEKSLDYARYVTFQRPLGSFGNSVLGLTRSWPVLKLFLPFVRTPTNIFKYAVERSPAAPALREVRDAFRKGGADRDLAAARMMLGTGLGLTVASLAAGGVISGNGPMDENARRLKMADGWQPYSVKIDGKWISYSRLDPLATTVGIAADLVDKQAQMTPKQAEQATALLVASIMSNLSNKTWLSGMSDLLEVFNDPQRSMRANVGRLAGSMTVPAGVAQTARTLDPTVRDVRGTGMADSALNSIKARVPGLSQTLPAKRDLWGETISRDAIGPNMLSPFPVTKARNDPINAELLASGAKVAPPQRTIKGQELTPKEYSEYAALAGNLLRSALGEMMKAPEFADLSPEEKRYEIDRLKREARAEARVYLFGDRFSGDDADDPIPAPPPGYAPLNMIRPDASDGPVGRPVLPNRSRLAIPSRSMPSPPTGFVIDPPPPGFVQDQ